MEIKYFDQSWGLEAYAFLSTLQVVVFEDSEFRNINNFGSGFFLRHKGRLFFVTADHVIHYGDFHENETGQRSKVECYPYIITNFKEQDGAMSAFIPLGGIYDYTEYTLDEDTIHNPDKFSSVSSKIVNQDIDINDESLPVGVTIPTFVDIAVCEVNEPLQRPILSKEVRVSDDEILVPADTIKLWLSSDHIAEFNKDDFYLVVGSICSEGDKQYIYQAPIKHIDMRFEKFGLYGEAYLRVWEYPDIKCWEGLSGSPVFNYNWELVGMLVSGPKCAPAFATVIPINQIIRTIDNNVTVENTLLK